MRSENLKTSTALYLLLIFLGVTTTSAFAAGVMSVNQCVDQMLGYLAPQKLASVTWLSHESRSIAIAPSLLKVPANHAEIEEVLRLQPDLVIGGQYGAPGLKALILKFGLNWRELPLPTDFTSLYGNWNTLGRWLAAEDVARQIVGRLQSGLQSVQQQLAPLKVRTVLINANGWIAGANNFQDAFLQALGLRNLAAESGIQGWGQISLEQLVHWQPDLIIVPESHYGGQARATQWLEHPVLAHIHGRYPLLKVDAEWLSCGTPELLRAAEMIRQHIAAPARVPDVS